MKTLNRCISLPRRLLGILGVAVLLGANPWSRSFAEKAKLRIFDENNILPLAYHLGLDYTPNNTMDISLQGIEHKPGLGNIPKGLEWTPFSMFSARLGYKPDAALPGSSPYAALAAGVALKLVNGPTLAYATTPFSGGAAHYFSLTLRFK